MSGVLSVSEALQSLEQTCKLDAKCHSTAVTFVDGEPACEYHSGDILRSDQV